MIEVWKDIPGFEGLYQASSLGRIRGVERKVPFRGSLTTKRAKIKNQRKLGDYMIVGLCKNSRVCSFLVHRLVAIAFVPNTENKTTVNHKDFNPMNNNADNLEWATQKENIHASVAEMRHCHGETHGCSKLTDDQVREIRSFKSGSTAIAKVYDISYSTLKKIRSKKTWRHVV